MRREWPAPWQAEIERNDKKKKQNEKMLWILQKKNYAHKGSAWYIDRFILKISRTQALTIFTFVFIYLGFSSLEPARSSLQLPTSRRLAPFPSLLSGGRERRAWKDVSYMFWATKKYTNFQESYDVDENYQVEENDSTDRDKGLLILMNMKTLLVVTLQRVQLELETQRWNPQLISGCLPEYNLYDEI